MLPLSYLLCSILCVAILAALGTERKLRGLILLPLTLLVALVAWQFGAAAEDLPGGGGRVAWAWIPLAVAWWAALAGRSESRWIPLAVLLLAGLTVWGFAAPAAAPATVLVLAVHRTLAVALAAVALAALVRLSSGFPQGPQLAPWRFVSLLSAGMLLGLILALAYLYFFQNAPLGLDPRIAWTVLLAETLAAFCVYRGVHTVTQSGTTVSGTTVTGTTVSGGGLGQGDGARAAEPAGGSSSVARATALLVLFALTGGGLILIPIILNGATRLSE